MQSVRQMAVRGALRARPTNLAARPRPLRPVQAVRLAHQSYGNEQSGMEQGTHLKNPKSDLEHPGPEAPANKGSISKEETSSSSSPSSSSDSPSSSSSPSNSSDSGEKTSQGARPAIHSPKSAAEENDPEVKKHNEEMAQRSDRSVNQLSEDDNKVNPNFWKGTFGSPDREV